MKKTYRWNKERGCLEEFISSNRLLPQLPHDEKHNFRRGLGQIREIIGSGGTKKHGFAISPERNR